MNKCRGGKERNVGAHGLADADRRLRVGHSVRPSHGYPGRNVPQDLDQKFFEFDRKRVVEMLDALREVAHQGATQLDIIADSTGITKSLSTHFSRVAQRLSRVARKLEDVLEKVANASGYPKDTVLEERSHAMMRRLHSRKI